MLTALDHLAEAAAPGDPAALERVLRDERLAVVGNDPGTAGQAHRALASLLEDRGDLTGATEQLRSAVAGLVAAGDDKNLAFALERLASLAEGRGDVSEASRYRQELVPVAEEARVPDIGRGAIPGT